MTNKEAIELAAKESERRKVTMRNVTKYDRAFERRVDLAELAMSINAPAATTVGPHTASETLRMFRAAIAKLESSPYQDPVTAIREWAKKRKMQETRHSGNGVFFVQEKHQNYELLDFIDSLAKSE